MAKILYLYAQPFRAKSHHARRALQMLSLLQQAGHAVEILSLPGGDPWPKGIAKKIYFTSRVPFVKSLPFYGQGFRRMWAGVVMFLAAFRLSCRERYDALHCSDRAIRTGGFLSWLFRKPFIFEWYATHSGHDLVKWLARRSRPFRRSINMIFSDFPYPFSRLRQIGVYGRIAALQLLPATNITPQPPPATRIHGEHQVFRLVAFANSPDLQDLSALMSLLPQLFEHTALHVTVVGSTPRANERYRRSLQPLLGKALNRLTFLPAVTPNDHLIRATADADLVYLSAFHGPLPPPLLIDLMASRKAIFAIQCPAFQSLLNPSNATLVPYDAQAIGEALLRAMRTPQLCSDHAQAAYATIHAERDAKTIAEEVRRCYELALEETLT